MLNSLMQDVHIPFFSQIKVEDIVPTVQALISHNHKTIQELLSLSEPYTFDNFIYPLELLENRLNEVIGLVSHLNAVKDTAELRQAYEVILPMITEYHVDKGQDEALYKAFLSIKESPAFNSLNISQQKIIENALRDFKLSGVSLGKEDREKVKKLSAELSGLENQFEKNILDATDAWALHITDKEKLKGLPEHTLSTTQRMAEKQKKDGWVITLDYPTFDAVMRCAEDRELRESVHKGYFTLASDKGSNEKWDNGPLMVEILNKRQALAKVLGFKNFTEYSLVTKMLKSPGRVLSFLNELVEALKSKGIKDYEELNEFAIKEYQLADIKPWDVHFLSEKLQEKSYHFNEEECRKYFPEKHVLQGLFRVAKELYDINIEEVIDFDPWHKDVKLYKIYDKENNLRGHFFIDLYARANKRKGAWCGNLKVRLKENNKLQLPIAYIVCNFRAPKDEEREAHLSHNEVVTLFHEFGHCLHDVLTLIEYPSISGGNGVAWDAIELPSQLMEHWCWEKEGIDLISKDVKTGQGLPNDLFLKLKSAKNFQLGLGILRQLEFALFDFTIHSEEIREYSDVLSILEKVRTKTTVFPAASYNRFQNSFTHIFSGGYASAYYSYLWSDVLSEDVYELFIENNTIFNKEAAQRFLSIILERGGSQEFMSLFKEFRGREPSIQPLLKEWDLLN